MESLVTILKEQVKGYQTLLELAREKQRVLIENDIKALEQINAHEQKQILAISKLENTRLQVVNSLTEVLGAEAPNYTLQEMAEKSPEPFNNDLHKIYEELNNIVDQLSKINQENSDLVTQALKIVNFTIDSIVKEEREVTYPEKDPKNTKQTSRIFDSKA